MPSAMKAIPARILLCVVAMAAAACSPRKIPPMTASDFMEDRVALDGKILKCNQDATLERSDPECANARIAVERLASQQEATNQAKTAAEFERSREQLRLMQEKQRQEEQAKNQVDAYHLPLVPVDGDPPTSNVAAASPR